MTREGAWRVWEAKYNLILNQEGIKTGLFLSWPSLSATGRSKFIFGHRLWHYHIIFFGETIANYLFDSDRNHDLTKWRSAGILRLWVPVLMRNVHLALTISTTSLGPEATSQCQWNSDTIRPLCWFPVSSTAGLTNWYQLMPDTLSWSSWLLVSVAGLH